MMNIERSTAEAEKNDKPLDNQELRDGKLSHWELKDTDGRPLGQVEALLGEEINYQVSDSKVIKCHQLRQLTISSHDGLKIELSKLFDLENSPNNIAVLLAEGQTEDTYFHKDHTVISRKPESVTDITLLLHRLAEAKQANEDLVVKKILDLEVDRIIPPTQQTATAYEKYAARIRSIVEALPELFDADEKERVEHWLKLSDEMVAKVRDYNESKYQKIKIDEEWDDLNYSLVQIIKSTVTGERQKMFQEWRESQQKWLRASEFMHEAQTRTITNLSLMGKIGSNDLALAAHHYVQKKAAEQVTKWYDGFDSEAVAKIRQSSIESYRARLTEEYLFKKNELANQTFAEMERQIKQDTKQHIRFAEQGIFEDKPVKFRLLGKKKDKNKEHFS